MAVERTVVITRDFSSIPPSGLDPLGFTEEPQRAATARKAIGRSKRLRYG
jgi:hypothetical protein